MLLRVTGAHRERAHDDAGHGTARSMLGSLLHRVHIEYEMEVVTDDAPPVRRKTRLVLFAPFYSLLLLIFLPRQAFTKTNIVLRKALRNKDAFSSLRRLSGGRSMTARLSRAVRQNATFCAICT
jgi:hypothetical protein|eukprot:COSAG06_NODE_15487_length_1067_cov_1.284091_1_plen_124_part_00